MNQRVHDRLRRVASRQNTLLKSMRQAFARQAPVVVEIPMA